MHLPEEHPMQLDEALGRISQIQTQIARTETFRGFRSLTVGFSGILGIAAAVIQAEFLPQPMASVGKYVELWVGVALFNILVVGVELAYRWSATSSPLKRRLTLFAIQQFAPCLVAGAALTAVLTGSARESAWMLPGLWAIVFSLGVFACCRFLPRETFWVGVYYLAAGTICLAVGNGPLALSPWLMAGTFGVGQLLAAGILFYTLERRHDQFEA
jgi:hypothetical protein